MASNPFFIQPVDLSSGLQGLGSMLAAKQKMDLAKEETAKKEERLAAFQQAAGAAQTPEDFGRLGAMYPEYSQAANMIVDARAKQLGMEREQLGSLYKRAFMSTDPKSVLEDYLAENPNATEVQGFMEDFGQAISDPEGFRRNTEIMWATLNPKEYESYKAAFGEAKDDEKLPASVQEYEFYKNLPEDEKKAFMLMKRGEKESTADRLARLEREAEINRRQEQLGREDEAREKSISEATAKVTQLWDTASIYDQMIRSIDEGAGIGRVNQLFPTIRSATAQFEQAAKNLGLRVISSTTFGALSEGELRLAMETAVPPISDPVEMRDYLVRKRAAQEKLADQMLAYIDHLRGGGTADSWISLQAKIRKERGGADSGSQQPNGAARPSQTPAQQTIPTITTQEEFDALPSGARFYEDGQLLIKD